MAHRLKPDEEFVIRALAAKFDGQWSPGEDPPDAYLTMGQETIAVEISTLTQHVTNARGGMKSRLSDDSAALRLAEELDEELRATIPRGCMVVLTLRAPITKLRPTKSALRERIAALAVNNASQEIEVERAILGNRIAVSISSYDGSDEKRVVAAIINSNSDPRIDLNARLILEERIATKAQKCGALPFDGPVWLALFNDYFLADEATYRQVLAQLSDTHPFEKIVLERFPVDVNRRARGIPLGSQIRFGISAATCGGMRWRRDTPRTSGRGRLSLSSPAKVHARRRAFSTSALRRPSVGWIAGGRPEMSKPSPAPDIAAHRWSGTSGG